MKNILVLLVLLSSYTLVQAQSKNDPTYSINNYKHPNKAEEAKLLKHEGVANDAYLPEGNVSGRNYKASNNQATASGASMKAVPVEKNTNALAASGNYKSAFGKQKRGQSEADQESYSNPVVKGKKEGSGVH